jgi:protein involved in polysaccharide export with SLBB domain
MPRQTFSAFATRAVTTGIAFLALAVSAPSAISSPLDLNSTLSLTSQADGTASQATQAAGMAPANGQPGPTAPVPELRTQPPQFFDYSANLASDVFGANLFTGAFARQGATQFNPDYAVAVGDQIQVRLWGAFDFDAPLVVDPQGNIFIPHAGPIRVLGVRNHDLQRIVDAAVGKVFRSNVFGYASIAAAQPVRVFVSGNVHRPGLYSGTSMDSLLHYLDQAGGIDPERGSFLDVQVKRGEQIRVSVNLYDFLLNGTMPLTQLANGDVIFVSQRKNTVRVGGLAENAKRFEFAGDSRTVADLVKMAKPRAAATHVRVVRNTGAVKNVEYYPLAEVARVILRNGDEIEFTADKKPGTITVRVEGEHQSAQEYVLPYGTRMSELLGKIEYSDRSDRDSLQLFRLSVKERQRQMLFTSLKSLEAAALNNRSGSGEEAQLRKAEAELILQWVERARKIEPLGQVMISQADKRGELLLENGDILRVPTRDGLVLVSGEVLFPNAIAFDQHLGFDEYIRRAGGYTRNADVARVIIAHRDGSFGEIGSGFFSTNSGDINVKPGDEILVLPKVDVKSRMIARDLIQMVYQIAVSAKIIFDLN